MLLDVACAAGYMVAAIATLTQDRDHPLRVSQTVVVACAAVMTLGIVGRRRWPSWLCAMAVAATPLLVSISPLPIFMYSLAKYGRRLIWVAVLPFAAAAICAAINLFPEHGGLMPGGDLALLGYVVAPLLLGFDARARQTQSDQQIRKADYSEREQALMRRTIILEERARIAREMHDVVAHPVSLIVILANAVHSDKMANEDTARIVKLIGDMGGKTLVGLRDVLGSLRLESERGIDSRVDANDLAELISYSRVAGMDVELVSSGEDECRDLDPAVNRMVYCIVREALTNVHKHAGSSATRIELHYDNLSVQLVIENEKPRKIPGPTIPGSGYGLRGLAGRITAFGGEFRVAPSLEGGFRVTAILPTKGLKS
ncbi:sensor histidine kinase [Streptomyces lavendulocolor]|uniref:sensor histidine kinase n=1 Tax=Streptomyces lavendulocolor TaxID=67316 RepID=UPI0033EFBC73